MALSARAERLIEMGQRVERPTTREQIVPLLESANITVSETFLDFQERFGGLQIYAAAMQEMAELSLLFDPGDGNYQIAGVDDDGEWILAAGRFGNSDHLLMLDEDGIVYADTVPIADSIEKWLEPHALAAEMQVQQPEWHGTPYMTVHRDDRRFDEAVESAGFARISEACDDYGRWWGDESVRFERSVMWDAANQSHAIRGFARTADHVPQILAPFTTVFGSSPPVLAWPYRIENGEPATPSNAG